MDINFHPSIRQLRTFGLMSLAALPLGAAIWTHGSWTTVGCAAAAGGVLAAVGLAWPQGLRPILVMLNVITWPLVLIVHDMVLIAAFFGVLVPVGFVFRLFGRDPLQLKLDRRAATYWQPKPRPADVRSYFRRW